MQSRTIGWIAFVLASGCASASNSDDFGSRRDLAAPMDFSVEDLAVMPDLSADDGLEVDGPNTTDLAKAVDLAPDFAGPDSSSPATTLVISQIRSRAAGGASDEFVELYNPTAAAVTLDNTWIVEARSTTAGSFTTRWTGANESLPAHGHILIAGTAYAQQPAADAALSTGITDASAVRLSHGGTVLDTVCYAFDATTQMALTSDTTFGCPGTPADNSPHNNASSAASNVDQSIERKPGGAAGNATNTGNNAADFAKDTPAVPRSLASPPAP